MKRIVKRPKDPKRLDQWWAFERAMLSAGIAHKALNGESEPPEGRALNEWVSYNIARAIEDLARGLQIGVEDNAK